MDRKDIVRLFIVYNVPLPGEHKLIRPHLEDGAPF